MGPKGEAIMWDVNKCVEEVMDEAREIARGYRFEGDKVGISGDLVQAVIKAVANAESRGFEHGLKAGNLDAYNAGYAKAQQDAKTGVG
jgi:hypothetical protein